MQFAALVLIILGMALHGESRLTAIEQAVKDGDTSRAEIIRHVENIDARIDAAFNRR